MRTVTVAPPDGVQLEPQNKTLPAYEALVREAASQGARIILLQEVLKR